MKNKKASKGQISFEYIVIVSVAILLLIPGLFFFITYTKGGSEKSLDNAIKNLGQEFISNSLRVYSLGKNSWLTPTINIPKEVDSIYLTTDGHNQELVIDYYVYQGITSSVFFPKINFTDKNGKYPVNPNEKIILLNKTGTHDIMFKSLGNRVLVELED